jgi:Putative beta-lactamase-inhibitor-like, PepSY-like
MVMRTRCGLLVYWAVLCGVALSPIIASAETQTTKKAAKPKRTKETTVSETTLPEKVRKTFVDKFPNAAINKVDEGKEGGVNVWDIEFREGRTHKETDIAEDGTMLEYTVFVPKKSVPKAAMKQMEAAAQDAKMGRVERIEVTYETKDGKVLKLEKPHTKYAVELTKGDKMAEIVVDPNGKIIEERKWEEPEAAAKESV